ncbi:MAG: carboxypeptidase-like regulatory domain-containing protein, partial [Actinomycetota bacterium]|nr:carboxypeptidase-like regulatory domain-containing protein [Actinomycetota bacterium]
MSFPQLNAKYVYPSYGPLVGNISVGYIYPRGAHGGMYPFDATLNPNLTYIFVGKDGGGTNPGLPYANTSVPPQPFTAPGSDPRLFIPTGPEYECQVLNPQFATSGNNNAPLDSTPLGSRFDSTVSNPGITVGDYVTPYYLAGVDDQGAFSGGTYTAAPTRGNASSTGRDRPVSNYTTGGGGNGTRHPAEWLQLQRVPAALQDNQGGVLYTVNFTAPQSGSDFYVDVIAFDKAAFPNILNTGYRGARTNWRIYDNVGGFSTNQSIGNNDILVVSDYALGQKFASTTFSGRNSNLNLVPKLFGTESYLTDIDVSYLPDSVYGGVPYPLETPTPNGTPAQSTYQFDAVVQPFFRLAAQNGLGVGSYLDGVIDDGTTTPDGASNVNSQRYSIWRILSRGPVPQRVLNSYLPNAIPQPAVVDPGDPSVGGVYKNVPAKTVLDAHRCVVWLSPYTGDVLEDPGALDDPGTVNGVGRNSTTKNLTAFVQAGGRLFLTGQDVGSTLTQGGTLGNKPSANPNAPNFLPDVLNATLASTGTTVRVLTGAGKRITGNPQFDGNYLGFYPQINGGYGDPGYFGGFGVVFSVFPYQKDMVIGDSDYGDSALSQIPPLLLSTGASLQGQPDTIAAVNGAVADASYGPGGPTALVYHDDPFGLPATGATAGALPNGGTGSRVVYAAFGLEAISNDYYSPVPPSENAAIGPPQVPFDTRIPPVAPRNTRSELLHSIVDFLRTGQVTGTINQTAGTGQGVNPLDGATVYLVSATGAAPPTRITFSALTTNGGRFTIAGVEPGTYYLAAVKAGFLRGTSNSNTPFNVEGDVTVSGLSLTLAALPPGSIAGLVHDTAGNPVSGATIVFTSQDNSITERITTPSTIPPSVTQTDNYYLQNVPVTTYTGLATGPTNGQGLPEYQSATGQPSVAPDPPNDKGFAVPSSPTMDGVNFTLTPILASITGRIYDNTAGDNATGGALTAGATVTLTDSAGKAVPGVAPVSAAADGTYTFTNVPVTQTPTTYTITATKAGYSTTGNTTTATVVLGSKITGADIGLTPIPVGILTGQVTDKGTTTGVAGALVTFVSSDGTVTLTATADGNGNYTIAKVPPGNYNGTATGPLNPNGHPTAASDAPVPVTVVSSPPPTPANLDVIPTPPSFAGTVTDSTTKMPLQGVLITITDTSTGPTKGNVVTTTHTKADGTYAT